MRTTDGDRAWRRAMAAYIRNDDARVPPAGRFNFGQKQLFWIMVLGGAALLVSGVVLWIPQAVPPSQRWLLESRGAAPRGVGAGHDRRRSSSTSTWGWRSCPAACTRSCTAMSVKPGPAITIVPGSTRRRPGTAAA